MSKDVHTLKSLRDYVEVNLRNNDPIVKKWFDLAEDMSLTKEHALYGIIRSLSDKCTQFEKQLIHEISTSSHTIIIKN